MRAQIMTPDLKIELIEVGHLMYSFSMQVVPGFKKSLNPGYPKIFLKAQSKHHFLYAL